MATVPQVGRWYLADPARFNFACRVVAGSWLVLVTTSSMALRPTYQDFTLYYVAGVCARLGEWSALYPDLGDPAHASTLQFLDQELLKPRTREIARQYAGRVPLPYIQPAWNALLFAPLSLLPFRVAHALWIALLVACVFAVAVMAGRTYALCAGRNATAPSRMVGLLTLAVALSPLAYRTIRVGNPSAIVGACLGLAVIDFLRRDGWRAALAIWLAGLLKYASAMLLPLALVARRYQTLVAVAVLGVVTVALTIAIAGIDPLREFATVSRHIGKSTTTPGNQSLHGFLLRVHGSAPLPPSWMITMRVAQWVSLACILGFMLRRAGRRHRSEWTSAPMMFAATVALVGWLVIFGPLFWEHYHIYFVPFWGWLAWEASRSWGVRIAAILAIALAWLPLPAYTWFKPPEPIASYMLWSVCLMITIALRRLAIGASSATDNVAAPRQPADARVRLAASLGNNPQRFNRRCALVGLAFLLLTIWGRWWWHDRQGIAQWQDFPQYYMGGVIAAERTWEAMYPIPNPGSRANAGFEDHSTVRPGYQERLTERGLTERMVRYIQPPPLTLILSPLALLPFRFSLLVWHTLLALAAWGIGLTAAEMYRLSRGGAASWVGGVLILLVCCSPMALRWVRVGNMSAVVGWLIGYAMLELVRRDGPRAAAALVLGTMSKYAIAVLAPLYLAMRRWRTIVWAVAMGAAWVGISLLIMGVGPFQTFVTEIAPTLGRSSGVVTNHALYVLVRRGFEVGEGDPMPQSLQIAFVAAQIAVLVAILSFIVVQKLEYWQVPAHVFAAGLALVSWLLIFSPIFWEHYVAYLAPFWGWLAFEATRSWLRAILAGLAIALTFAPWALVMRHLHIPRLPELLAVTLLWSAVLMLALAIATLVRRDA